MRANYILEISKYPPEAILIEVLREASPDLRKFVNMLLSSYLA